MSLYIVPLPTTPPPGTGNCPSDEWVKYGTTCLLYQPDKRVDWDTARMACDALNSTLASVSDYEKNFFVWNAMYDKSEYPTSVGCFIGLYKKAAGKSELI